MGFWSKAIFQQKNLHKKSTNTTTAKNTTKARYLIETISQQKFQRQECPILQQEAQIKRKSQQQQREKQEEENCKLKRQNLQQQDNNSTQQQQKQQQNQDPPTLKLFQLKAPTSNIKSCNSTQENHQKLKQKLQQKNQNPNQSTFEAAITTTKITAKTKAATTTNFHYIRKQEKCEKQFYPFHANGVKSVFNFRASLCGEKVFLLKSKKQLNTSLPWIYVLFLLSVVICCCASNFPTATAQSAASDFRTSTTISVASSTSRMTTIAPLAVYATLVATTIASVSAASAAAAYVDSDGIASAPFFDAKPLELNANDEEEEEEAETNSEIDKSQNSLEHERALVHGEPGEELMYAYYKRAQRHQQQQKQQQQQFLQRRHEHREHASAANLPAAVVDPSPTSTSQEFRFDEIVPTLGMASVLANSKKFKNSRTQKRSDKTSPDTSKTTATVAGATAPSKAATQTTKKPPSLSTPAAAATPTSSSSYSTSSSSSATSSSASSSTPSPDDEKCEPKVLDEVPTEPFYDFSDVAEDAARQFTEFLANKFPSGPPHPKHNVSLELRQEITRRAYGIASYALNEDDNLMAFAIAAPNVHTVVLKFRSNVTVPPEQAQNKSFLGSYWRELITALNSTDGSQEWGAPFKDCNLLKKRWLWPFRVSYSEYKFKIVTAAFIAADEDVCNDGLEEVFGRRHGCDRNTTFCLLTENKPLPPRDVYTCICKESFYLPNSTLQGFAGDVVEMSEGFDNYSCIPCPGGCTHCDQNGECLLSGEPTEVVSLESLMKVTVGTILGGCILCCLVLSVIVFRQRKSKAIAIGMWIVLETILLGMILLYASVAVHFFPASTERCLIEPWLRELGFVIFYGAIILKLYRHLVDFRTRKAHRWVLRDIDLLKYLGTMIFAVLCYLAGFTASSLDLLESALLESLREISTNTCLPLKWDYVTQTSEILILLFGLHLSFASRNANTQFRERQFLVATLVLEFIVSTTFYVLRFIYLQDMSPSTIFLALFVRSQLTHTISLGLIFVPKLWYQHKQVRSLAYDLSIRLPVDAFKGSHDVGQRLGGGYAGLCLGDPDIGELTISEMSPEDIRAELKRLYTQLEILKNKTLRQDNPHISKRRGGRKAGHRRFSLQALSAKHRSHKHHQDIEITEAEPSRTPEDSVCSVEGPTDAEISGISHSMLSHSVISHSVISHSK